ncbi:hypothetical protein L1887_31746 [Cichorium endivia]|nr:hypothetical protein L1887_31746 [Cichorium endivia]
MAQDNSSGVYGVSHNFPCLWMSYALSSNKIVVWEVSLLCGFHGGLVPVLAIEEVNSPECGDISNGTMEM